MTDTGREEVKETGADNMYEALTITYPKDAGPTIVMPRPTLRHRALWKLGLWLCRISAERSF
jgi:hypothetical protein